MSFQVRTVGDISAQESVPERQQAEVAHVVTVVVRVEVGGAQENEVTAREVVITVSILGFVQSPYQPDSKR